MGASEALGRLHGHGIARVTVSRPPVDAPLAQLLDRLAAEGDDSGEAYERLRRLLCRYFEVRRQQNADLLADEVLDRLALKVDKGTPVDDVSAYARGIARLVLLEAQRRPAGGPLDFEPEATPPQPQDDAAECLGACLSALDTGTRRQVLTYYAHDGRARIEHRKGLATALGISQTALRLRMLRLRMQLEHCITGCRARREGNGMARRSTPS